MVRAGFFSVTTVCSMLRRVATARCSSLSMLSVICLSCCSARVSWGVCSLRMRRARRRVGSGDGIGVCGAGGGVIVVVVGGGRGAVGVGLVGGGVCGVGVVCLAASFLSSSSISSSRFFSKIFSFFLRKLNIGHRGGDGLWFIFGWLPSFPGFFVRVLRLRFVGGWRGCRVVLGFLGCV